MNVLFAAGSLFLLLYASFTAAGGDFQKAAFYMAFDLLLAFLLLVFLVSREDEK